MSPSVAHFESTSTARCCGRCPRLSHTLNQRLQRDAVQDVRLSHTLNQCLQRDAMQDVRLSHTLNQCLQRDAMQDVRLSHTLNQCLQRDAMQDVRLSHVDILSKRSNIPSSFFHRRIARPFCVSIRNCIAIFRWGPCNGASNARGCEKIMIFDRYLTLSWK